MKPKFYVTTAIAYTNARPHVGHAMEFIHADVIARYHRMIGDDTRFLTGTDEHGSKMDKTARETGIPVAELAEQNVKPFQKLMSEYNISHDDFIRTTEDRHKRGAQKLWGKMVENGDIYKDAYKGLYCVGCEAYIQEKDLVNGKCQNHDKAPEELEEENYFFRFTKYTKRVAELIESGELEIFPESRKNEILNIIRESEDVSFSRPKKMLNWGVEVPGDPDHVMYVWCDALSNYITALGYADDGENLRYWPADLHIIGKDILRFHAGIWIAMLLSAGEQIPKAIGVHGFITTEGKKMSKSLGNVVDPFELLDEHGCDPVRYYFTREIPTTDDGDFSRERFAILYESELVNSLSNLAYRVLSMAEKYCDGKIPEKTGDDLQGEVSTAWKNYHGHIRNYDLKAAMESAILLVDYGNKHIENAKPWELAKTDSRKVCGVIYNLLELLRHIGMMISPYMPKTASKLQRKLAWEPDGKPFKESTRWGVLESGKKIEKGEPLFKR